jgi:prepilin-type N-terminal cleavage/methylation domain-containing protein
MIKNILKKNSEQGFTLVEVLMAIMILAICATGLIVVLTQTTRLLMQTDLQESARNLATAQLEYIKNWDYDSASAEVDLTYPTDPQLDTKYGLVTNVVSVVRLHPIGSTETEDEGVQKITLNILQGSNILASLEGYKANWYD